MVERWGGKKYLIEVKPGYVYVRKGGKYLGRITVPEGTAEFDHQYWDILTGRKHESKTSWKSLIASYRASDRWTKLARKTRQTYEPVLLYIEKKNGRRDMTRLQRKDVINAQKANTHRTRFANNIAAVMSVLCEHAIDIGWISANPAKGVRKLEIPKEKRKPHIPWTDEAVTKFRAEASFDARLIFEIGLGSIQRPGDWVDFTWGDFDGQNLDLSQNKTGVELLLPCDPPLRAILAEARSQLSASPHPTRPILTNSLGGKTTYRYMSSIMRKERERLGLLEFDLHGLRYRGVMELAWAGCDDDEIMSYSGHATKDMVRKYAGKARQIMRARSASEKRQIWAQL